MPDAVDKVRHDVKMLCSVLCSNLPLLIDACCSFKEEVTDTFLGSLCSNLPLLTGQFRP